MVDFLETQIMDKEIRYARADNRGNLTLRINDIEIFVEDGPYENWHYIDYQRCLQVHGGCGRVV